MRASAMVCQSVRANRVVCVCVCMLKCAFVFFLYNRNNCAVDIFDLAP